jgi:programmed cell death protein 5
LEALVVVAVVDKMTSKSDSEFIHNGALQNLVTNLANLLVRKQDEARQHILNQILHPEAADRLGRIRLVKEQRATDVENRLIMLAQTGQLRQKVTEEQLKELLNAVADNKEEEKIVVSRRKAWDDDDDDLLDL